MAEIKVLQTGRKHFSFHSVFKRLVLQIHKNQGLFGKGLTMIPKVMINTAKNNYFNANCSDTRALNHSS